MENKKSINFFFGMIAIILGSVLFKQFDFENLTFKHTGLAIIYLVVFAFSIYFLISNYRKRSEK